MDTWGIEVVIQLCRLQIQREREALMTPKIRGAAESLRKLRSFAEDESTKLSKRIDAVTTDMVGAFKDAHGTVDDLSKGVGEIEDFVSELRGANGGDPLEQSEPPSDAERAAAPRSSEVASR